MGTLTKIGIIGDLNSANPTHIATNEGIQHAAESLGEPVEMAWLSTDKPQELQHFHGLFCSPGSPYRSLDGALAGIRYARERQIPFLGTCGGCQHLILEYARNVMGIRDAAHAETDPYASCLFITPLSCSLAGKIMEVRIKDGSRAAAAYQAPTAMEAYYCNFGLNPAFRETLEDAGLEISGTDQDGEVRIVELRSHPFFLGTLFVPQARSTRESPHSVVVEFVRSAAVLRH